MLLDEAPSALKKYAFALTPGPTRNTTPSDSNLALAVVGLVAVCERGYLPYAWRGAEKNARSAVDILYDLVLGSVREVMEGAGLGSNVIVHALARDFESLDWQIRTFKKTPSSWARSN